MTDRMGDTALAETLVAITEHQARLRALLDRCDPSSVATRPPSGEWSAIENVRHLILSAQFQLGPFVVGGLGMSPLGLPQGVHPDTNASTDVGAVLAEWDRVHADLADRLDVSDPSLAVSVPRRAHGRLALRAVSEVTGEVVRLPRASRNPTR